VILPQDRPQARQAVIRLSSVRMSLKVVVSGRFLLMNNEHNCQSRPAGRVPVLPGGLDHGLHAPRPVEKARNTLYSLSTCSQTDGRGRKHTAFMVQIFADQWNRKETFCT